MINLFFVQLSAKIKSFAKNEIINHAFNSEILKLLFYIEYNISLISYVPGYIVFRYLFKFWLQF